MVDLLSSTDGGTGQNVAEPSPASASSTPVSGQVVRPKERSAVRRKDKRQNFEGEDGGRRHRAGPPPSEGQLSKPDHGAGGGPPQSCRNRRPAPDRTKAPEGAGARVLDQPGGASAEESQHVHALEATQRLFEAVSAQLERWYERKVDEARLRTTERTRADRTALVDRISHLEEELRWLRAAGELGRGRDAPEAELAKTGGRG